MAEQLDPREFELIGFVRNGYASHVKKAVSSEIPGWLTGLGRLDHLYHLLATAEMIAWIRLGEAIGGFVEGSSERLWDRTDERAKRAFIKGPVSSVLHRIGSRREWTPIHMVLQADSHRFANAIPSREAGEHEWLWVRTELLLAQEFGRARTVKGFLAALAGHSDKEWNETFEILGRGVEVRSRERALDRLIMTLRETASSEDEDVGAWGPGHFQLLAGFFRTVDHVSIVCDHSLAAPSALVSKTAAAIRRARLDFTNEELRRRFLAIADVSALVWSEARNRSPDQALTQDEDFPDSDRLGWLMATW